MEKIEAGCPETCKRVKKVLTEQRRRFVAACIAATATFSGVVMAPSALAQSSQPPIKIGVLLGFTGPAAFLAAGSMIAIRMGLKEINDAGGLLGRRLEIVQADDQFNPTQAVNEA